MAVRTVVTRCFPVDALIDKAADVDLIIVVGVVDTAGSPVSFSALTGRDRYDAVRLAAT